MRPVPYMDGLRQFGPGYAEDLANHQGLAIKDSTESSADTGEVVRVRVAPVSEGTIALSFNRGEIGVHGVEGKLCDVSALNDCDRDAVTTHDDAQSTYRRKWFVEGRELDRQTRCGAFGPSKYERGKFVGKIGLATKTEGVRIREVMRMSGR